MSGRRPDVTKAWDFEHHFRETLPNCTALPEAFKTSGWFTTGVGKLFHKNLPPNFDPQSWTDPADLPISYGYRNWNHANAGGPQDPESFDDCDRKLVDEALTRLALAAQRYHGAESQPFFVGCGLRNVHIPYHYPPAFGELYPPAASFATAAHPVMDASQPEVAWYDQQSGSKNQGVGTYGDVHASGDIHRHQPMNHTEAQIVRRNYYAATSYSDDQVRSNSNS
jgi:iduronate 2-sulfatase